MAELGSLYYSLHVKDNTAQEIEAINKRLRDIGSNIEINPEAFRKAMDKAAETPIKVTVEPKDGLSEKISDKIKDKAIEANIKPLTDSLVSNINSALMGKAVNIDTFTINGEGIRNAIQTALQANGFQAVGEQVGTELAKAVKVKFEGQTYTANVTANTTAMGTKIQDVLTLAERKEIKVRGDFKELKSTVENILKEKIKVQLDPQTQTTIADIEGKLQGKFVRVAVKPLTTDLVQGIRDALRGMTNPPEVTVGINSGVLERTIQAVLQRNGYILNVNTITGLQSAIRTILQGNHPITLYVDPTAVATSVRAALQNMQTNAFGLQVAKDVLYRSIEDALIQKKFPIQIKVMQDQARQAVQNALNQATNITPQNALTYQRLETGNLKREQAELVKLKQAHLQAKDAADAHARASINLGGAMGSNIRIAGELGAAMASLYSIHAAKEFLANVIEIGGELEHQKIALDTIYGDPGKTQTLFAQIKGMARQSPFGVMDLTKNIKQLSAYGVAYNEVYETAKRLADISAATSVDINRLILAFGKTKNRTFLDGLEAKQFAYANIPIYDALSKKLTELEGKFVSVKDVMGRIKKKEIGFDMVKEILWDMTDEGGKFYNMQEKLAGSVKTAWKLVKDNIELMFGEIAESSVGGGLKSMAQLLQGLTREWKTLATVIGAAAAVFGTYKLAVLLSNQMMGLHHASSLKAITASNELTVAKLREASIYRTLKATEQEEFVLKSALTKLNRSLLLSHKELTNAEWEAAIVQGKVTEDYILRRIALGRLTQAEIQYLITEGIVTQQQVATAQAANRATISLATLGAMIKSKVVAAWGSFVGWCGRVKASLVSVGTSIKNISWSSFVNGIKNIHKMEFPITRLKLALSGVLKVMKSIGSFVFNPATMIMAAVGGLMYIYEKNREELEKAKEIADNLFTKATEGAKNLESTLKDMKPAEAISTLEIKQGIEALENAIKDYSPTPLHDINEALYTQEGLLRPIEERYEMLRKKLEELKDSFDAISRGGLSAAMEGAINSTNGGWFDDDINTDIKDYDNAIKKLRTEITKFYSENTQDAVKAVQAALEASPDFAKATEGMKNYNQMFVELITNLENYQDAARKFSVNQATDNFHGMRNKVKTTKKEMTKEFTSLYSFLNARAKEIEKDLTGDLSEASDEIKKKYAIIINDWIKSQEVSEDVKKDLFIMAGIQLNFDFEFMNAQESLSAELGRILETEVGKELAEKVKNGLELTQEDKQKVFQALQKAYTTLYEQADAAEKVALQNAMQSQGEKGWFFDEGKEMNIVVTLNARADWEQWQREVDDATGNLPEIQTWVKGAADMPSFVKAVREGHKTAQATLDELKPLMLKAGLEFTVGQEIDENSWQFMSASEMEKEMMRGYNEAIRAINAAQKASDKFGFGLGDDKKKGRGNSKKGGTQKDEVAEQFKQRLKDLKDAWSEYKKWEKSVGDEAAALEVANSGLFGGMKLEEIPRTAEAYQEAIDKLTKELESKGVKGKPQRESLLNEMLKLLLDVKKEIVDEQIQKSLATIDEEIEKKLEEYDLYEKVRKATGNKDLAFAFTFGFDGQGETDFIKLTKDNFAKQLDAVRPVLEGEAATLQFDTINQDNVTLLPTEIQKAWEQAVAAIKKYQQEQRDFVADLLEQYQSTQDKIDKIQADADEAITKVWNDPKLNDAQKTNLELKIQVRADYEKFQLSNDYLQFFSGVYALTREEAERIGDAIRQHLNDELQKGAITASEYAEEIGKIEEQLEKIRGVKPKWLTMLTEGLSGVKTAELNKAIDERLEKGKELEEIQARLNKAKEEGDVDGAREAEKELEAKKEEIKVYDKIIDSISKSVKALENAMTVVDLISNILHGIADAVSTVREMAGSFGFDTDSNAWLDTQGVFDSMLAITDGISKVFKSVLSGDIGGVISGLVDTLISPITIWNKIHDRKLERDIEKSQAIYNKYQNLIDTLEGRLSFFLGNRRNLELDLTFEYGALDEVQKKIKDIDSLNAGKIFSKDQQRYAKEAQKYQDRIDAYNTGGALGYERQLMIEQLAELERQRADYENMKSDHADEIEDITKQINEQKQAIKDFAEEMANTVYGIDLNGWASQIGDALVDSFSRGEDAAEAFKSAVGDIMRSLVSQMITTDIIAPAMKDMEDWLFGVDGQGGAYGEDFLLDEAEVGMLGNMLGDLEDKIDAAKALYDAVNDAMGGGLDNKESSENSLRAGIQSITEDTADLLASYVNAIRAYVAQNSMTFDSLVNEAFPRLTIIAEGQLIQLNIIAENTRRNMEAAEATRLSVEKLETTLSRATVSKDNGFYIR